MKHFYFDLWTLNYLSLSRFSSKVLCRGKSGVEIDRLKRIVDIVLWMRLVLLLVFIFILWVCVGVVFSFSQSVAHFIDLISIDGQLNSRKIACERNKRHSMNITECVTTAFKRNSKRKIKVKQNKKLYYYLIWSDQEPNKKKWG